MLCFNCSNVVGLANVGNLKNDSIMEIGSTLVQPFCFVFLPGRVGGGGSGPGSGCGFRCDSGDVNADIDREIDTGCADTKTGRCQLLGRRLLLLLLRGGCRRHVVVVIVVGGDRFLRFDDGSGGGGSGGRSLGGQLMAELMMQLRRADIPSAGMVLMRRGMVGRVEMRRYPRRVSVVAAATVMNLLEVVVMKTGRHVVVLAASARSGSSGDSATAEIHFFFLQGTQLPFCDRKKKRQPSRYSKK